MSGGRQLDDEYWDRRNEVTTELRHAASPLGLSIYVNADNSVHISGDIIDVMEFTSDWRSEIEELG